LGGLVGHMPSDETRNSLTLNVPCNEWGNKVDIYICECSK
jgi:hypothetical protein